MSLNFDRAVDFYDQTRTLPPAAGRALREVIRQTVGATAETRYLEPGIGTGRVALPFLEAGDDYIGTDISAAMMRRLRARFPDAPLCLADITALPFAAASVDVVIVFHVFHVVRGWEQALDEIRRVLRPEGWLAWSWHWRGESALNRRIRQQLGAFVAARGFSTDRPGARTTAVVQAALAQQGAAQHEIEVAHWQGGTSSVRGELAALAARQTSDTWRLPDDLLVEALTTLEQWAVERYGSLDYTEPLEERLIVHFACF